MAPPMAANILGRPGFTVEDLTRELRWPPGVRFGLVEGVGGPRSPLASTGDTVSMATALQPDTVVLVARPELGTINAVLLAAAPLVHHSLVVFLNQYREGNPLHVRNADWLRDRAGLDVVTGIEPLLSRLL